MRKELHDRVAKGDEITQSDIEKVNTFSRLERMKDETRALTEAATTRRWEADEKTLKEFDRYDLLAVDWVTGQELEWEGSPPDICAKNILDSHP